MAKFKNPYKNTTKAVKSATEAMFKNNQSTTNNMQDKISNYNKRLQSTGVNVEEAKDTRNPIEKFLNLKEGQNVLFDVFEVLSRPQQALFTGIDEALNGGNFLEGVKEGIKGESTTSGGDILRTLGVSDNALFENPITKEDTSLADILGLGLDIFADPVDIPLVGKTTTTLSKGSNAAKKAMRAGNVLDETAQTIKVAKNSLAPFQKGSSTILEAAMGDLVKGAKKGVGLADNLITKGLEKSDTKALQNLIDAGGDVTNFASKADAYKGLKKSLGRTANYAESIPDNLYDTLTRSDNALDMVNAYGRRYADNLRSNVTKYAASTGEDVNNISSSIQKLISSKYAPETSMADAVIDVMKNGKVTIKTDKEQLNILKKTIDDFKIANNITDNVIDAKLTSNALKLTGNKKLLGNVIGTEDLMNKLSDIKFAKKMDFDEGTLKELKQLNDLYNGTSKKSKQFKKMVDDAERGYTEFNDAIKKATGENISFEDMLREGYVTNSLTEEGRNFLKTLKENNIGVSQKAVNARKSQYYNDILEGNKNVVEGRKYDAYAENANKQFSEDINKAVTSRQKEINYLETQRHENRIKNVEQSLKDNNMQLKNARETFDNNISKQNIKKETAIKLKQSYDKDFDELSDIIDDKVMKKAQKINDSNLVGTMAKRADVYAKKSNKVVKIQTELTKEGLSSSRINTLTKQLEKALDAQENAKNSLKYTVAKIQGAASETYIKDAGKLANQMVEKSSSLTKRAMNQQTKVTNALDKIQQAKESYQNIASQLMKQQSDLKLEYNNLKNMGMDAIKKANTKISDRVSKLQKDIDLLNSFEGKQLFSTDFFQGFDDYINKTTNQAKAMLNYHDALLNAGLSDTRAIKFIERGTSVTDVVGMVKLDTKKVNDYLDGMKNFMPKDSETIKEFKRLSNNSKDVYVDKGISELIELNKGMGPKEANVLLDTIDKASNLFKKTSTLSPGFQIRNITGNTSNMWLSGMKTTDIASAYKDAIRLSNSDYIIDLITKNAKNTLTKAEKSDYKIVSQFIESGAMGKGKSIRDLGDLIEKASSNKEAKNLAKKAWDGLFEINAKANEKMDNLSRMALLSHATKDQNYVAKLGAKDAISAMKEVLFDPQNLSPFEKKYMKRIIPFYTFTKQNLMFQMKNVVNNTSRYNKLIKAFNKTYDAIGQDNYRQYQKENFEIPVALGDSGLTTLKANLPLSDLGDYIANPLQRLVSSTNPLIKTPFEQVTGVDTFTGQEIEKNPLENLLDTTGLSNLTTKQIDKISSIYDSLSNGEEIMSQDNAWATLLPSVFRYSDKDKIAKQRQYDELQQYQQIINNLKNQGIDVPTIQELTSNTNSLIKKIGKQRKKSSS